jgi:hypothetical protein
MKNDQADLPHYSAKKLRCQKTFFIIQFFVLKAETVVEN